MLSHRGGSMFAQRSLRLLAIAWTAAVVAAGGIGSAFSEQVAAAANKVVVQVSDADPPKGNLRLTTLANLKPALTPRTSATKSVPTDPATGVWKPDPAWGTGTAR